MSSSHLTFVSSLKTKLMKIVYQREPFVKNYTSVLTLVTLK